MSSNNRPSNLQTPSSSSRGAAARRRRQTLGPMPHQGGAGRGPPVAPPRNNSNNTNRRQSLAGAPPPPPGSAVKPPAGAAAAARPRRSMIPRVGGRENAVPASPARSTASSRRQSVGGGTPKQQQPQARRQSLVPPSHGSGIRDPRPVSDRAFQHECGKKIWRYLQTHGYDHPLSAKTFKSPSGKDFGYMVTFLLRRIDPLFQNPSAGAQTLKLEDEIVLAFRAVGYPLGVSKTSLVAAGSPHAWPSLLAALAWLVDHLTALEGHLPPVELPAFADRADVTVTVDSVDDLNAQSQAAFFEFLPDAYHAFLEDDPDGLDTLRHLLQDRFTRDDAYLEEEVERLRSLNERIAAQMEELQNDVSGLPAYRAKRDDYKVDLEQFRDLIDKMEQHKQALQLKIDERSAELNTTNEKLESMNKHVADLKQTISTQTMSMDDLVKLQTEQKGIQEAADRTRKTIQQRKEALRVVETEMAQYLTQLDLAVADYNGKLSELSVQGTQWNAYKATVDKDHMESGDDRTLLGVDLHETVRPHAERQNQQLQEEIQDMQQTYQDALDQCAALSRSVDETTSKLHILQEKAGKATTTLQQEQEAHDQKQSVRQRELDTLESKVQTLRNPVALEEQMAGFRQECSRLEAQLARARDDGEVAVRQTQQQIHQALCLMQEHEAAVRTQLQELDDYWAQHVETLRELNLPKQCVES